MTTNTARHLPLPDDFDDLVWDGKPATARARALNVGCSPTTVHHRLRILFFRAYYGNDYANAIGLLLFTVWSQAQRKKLPKGTLGTTINEPFVLFDPEGVQRVAIEETGCIEKLRLFANLKPTEPDNLPPTFGIDDAWKAAFCTTVSLDAAMLSTAIINPFCAALMDIGSHKSVALLKALFDRSDKKLSKECQEFADWLRAENPNA